MLFKTIAEFKAVYPIVGTTDLNHIKPFIEQAERDYIIPLISKAQYDDLSSAYNVATPTLSAPQTALLSAVQKSLAIYALYLWTPSGQLSIGDNGIRIANTETMKTAFQWQIANLQTSLLLQAGSAADDMLAYMEANKANYTLWTASDAYTDFKETFITSAIQFTKLFYPLGNSRLNFLAIRASMLIVEDLDIQAELGEDYYTELKTQHKASNLSANNLKVYNILVKAIAFMTIRKAITNLSVTIDPRGILNFVSTSNTTTLDNKEPAKDHMIAKMESECEKHGRAYIQKVKDFLAANIADYSTYAASSAYDSETTDTSFQNSEDSKNFGMI